MDVIRYNYTLLFSKAKLLKGTMYASLLPVLYFLFLHLFLGQPSPPLSTETVHLLSWAPATAAPFCDRALLPLAPRPLLSLVDHSSFFCLAYPRSPSGVCLPHSWASLRLQNASNQGLGFLFPSPVLPSFIWPLVLNTISKHCRFYLHGFLNPSTSSSCTACSLDQSSVGSLGLLPNLFSSFWTSALYRPFST